MGLMSSSAASTPSVQWGDPRKAELQEELVTEAVLDVLVRCPKSQRSRENADWNVLINILRWSGCRIAEALILR
jgi:hypothetical protein